MVNQFEYYDLEPIGNDLRIDTEEIKHLRDEYEYNKKHISIEPNIFKKNKEQIMQQNIDEENKRKYHGKNINKDHNGQIIFIKSIKLDKLKKDFIIGKSKIKNIIENSSKRVNKLKLSNKIKKNNQNIKEDITVKSTPKKKNKNINVKSLPKLNSKTKLSMPKVETPGRKEETRNISFKKKKPIVIGGNNFDLMKMETGVAIKEDEKYKTGGFDFQNKFNKFSLQSYDKMLKEVESSYYRNIQLRDEFKVKGIEETNNLYPSSYTMTSFGNNYNTIQTEPSNYSSQNFRKKMQMSHTNNFSILNQYMNNIASSSNNIAEKTKRNNQSLKPFIYLTMGASTLISSFDKLNLDQSKKEENHKKRINIFRRGIRDDIQKESKFSLDNINIFTKNIITNKEFGNQEDKRMKTIGGIKNPGKRGLRTLIQEMGIKGKNLRNRNRNNNRNFFPFKSSYIETENFFKQ